MTDPSTCTSLLARVCDHTDSRAWEQFSALYGELIVRFCLRRGMQLGDAEDVRQIVLLALLRSLGSPNGYDRGRGRFRDYLGGVVRHAAQRYCSQRNPSPSGLHLEDEEAATAALAEPDPLWEQEWRNHHLRRALEQLAQVLQPRSMDVFQRILSGEDPVAVATALSMKPEAVRKVKQRALDHLRELVSRQIRLEDERHG
jgi:RNA polymerase sigma factor (sigma-70 family)